MKNWTTNTLVIMAFVGGLPLTALAQERELQKSDVPAPVMKAVMTRHPGAQPSRFVREDKNGTTLYEVKLEVSGRPTELMVSPDGTLVAEEQVLEVRELPATVTSALAASPFAKAKILRAEKEVKGEDTHYELVVETRGRRTEVVIDAGGKLIKHEEKTVGGHDEAD